jgi:8-amino-7-oxononanoate synthase
MSPARFISDELGQLDALGLRRRMRAIDGAQDRVVLVDGTRVVSFSSNNYLGLANHPALRDAASTALSDGTGAGASRLIVGNMRAHRELEQGLATFFDAPSALVFNSGYQANLGVLQALAGRGDEIFSDVLNHASIIDGCRLSRAAVTVYPHGDVDALARGLSASTARRRIVVSDSVFSMDGDIAPVADIGALAAAHDAVWILDEAHAVGALGPGGRGIAAAAGVRPDVVVGTLGKAFGSFGAFALAERPVTELLINRARSFVFTTALPPPVVAASSAALQHLGSTKGRQLRRKLRSNIEMLRAGLVRLAICPQRSGMTPIFPIHIGDDREAMACADALLARGVYAQGIRPPTVPVGTARLRIALMATHTAEDIELLLAGLGELVAAGKVPAA